MKKSFHSSGNEETLKMIVTINESKTHWVVYLVYVDKLKTDGKENDVIFLKKYCSLNNSNHCKKEQHDRMIKCFEELWKMWYCGNKHLPTETHCCVEESLPKQSNGTDCGVFCCAVTTCLVDLLPNVKIDKITQEYIDENHFRSRICASILTGQLVLD